MKKTYFFRIIFGIAMLIAFIFSSIYYTKKMNGKGGIILFLSFTMLFLSYLRIWFKRFSLKLGMLFQLKNFDEDNLSDYYKGCERLGVYLGSVIGAVLPFILLNT